MSEAREILLYAQVTSVLALIPKRRGLGFLKVPAGHHATTFITDLEEAVGTDVYGLDGHLEFPVRFVTPEFLARVTAALMQAYGLPVREVGAEFWEKHPIRGAGDAGESRRGPAPGGG